MWSIYIGTISGADPVLTLTGAQTKKGHRRFLVLAGGVVGVLSVLQKPKGFRCSKMHSKPFLALRIIHFIDLPFRKFHLISVFS